MKPLAANTLLQNRYLIVHLIGKGGMGDVYLAIDQRLGSAVALKRTFFSGDETFSEAFEREAKTLARLRHSVLPKVSDHFIEDDTQYLIMEHIAGDDLAKRLEISQKPFPVNWVLFWADQLLDALDYLHSQEPPVIHRDIKPQNLKLTDDNSIVLLDFGLSKNTIAEVRTGTTGSVVGYTPHFAPMEQIRGTGTNPRSDIYSLSATLYQLLTNVVPPETLTRAEDLLGGKPDPIKAANEINEEVPQAVSDIILKGMAVSQEKRFSDAREMQKALREAHAQTQNRDAKQIAIFTTQSHNSVLGHSQPLLKTNVTTPPIDRKSPETFTRENSMRVQEISAQQITQSPEKKSSITFWTVLGVAAPLFLALTFGIGWFMMRNSEAATEKTPVLQPEAVIAVPSPEQTAEPAANTNANVSNESNENSLDEDTNTQIYNQTGKSRSQNSIENPSRATQPPNVKTTPKPSSRVTTKSTPKLPPPSKTPKATPLPRILP
jgi:serine/threonine protein kinase